MLTPFASKLLSLIAPNPFFFPPFFLFFLFFSVFPLFSFSVSLSLFLSPCFSLPFFISFFLYHFSSFPLSPDGDDCVSSLPDVYERAIANVPPVLEKRFWRRYVYLFIYYALFEETIVSDAFPWSCYSYFLLLELIGAIQPEASANRAY